MLKLGKICYGQKSMILLKEPGFDASLLLLRTFKNEAKIYFCEVQDLFKIQSTNFSSKLSPRCSKTKPLWLLGLLAILTIFKHT